jgi:hypothetical protein
LPVLVISLSLSLDQTHTNLKPEKLEKKLNTIKVTPVTLQHDEVRRERERERGERGERGSGKIGCQAEFISTDLTLLAPNTYMQGVYSNGYPIIRSYPSVGSLVSSENLDSEK